jgi:hypothetical protein
MAPSVLGRVDVALLPLLRSADQQNDYGLQRL